MNKLPILLLALCAPLAQAGETDAAPARTGDETRAWLNLQTGGSAAAPERPMNGEVADKVYERYVNSFGRPIPDSFVRESATTEGGGGGGAP